MPLCAVCVATGVVHTFPTDRLGSFLGSKTTGDARFLGWVVPSQVPAFLASSCYFWARVPVFFIQIPAYAPGSCVCEPGNWSLHWDRNQAFSSRFLGICRAVPGAGRACFLGWFLGTVRCVSWAGFYELAGHL